MSLELVYLLWSAVLAFAYMMAQAAAYRMQAGVADASSTRDREPEPDILTGRATRALRNFQETYPIFIALAVVTIASGRSDGFTQWGAIVWFWSRAAYLPAYLLGLNPYRSWVGAVSAIGLIMIFVGIVW
jgi:uncharacterized MAPEG superfamily protein